MLLLLILCLRLNQNLRLRLRLRLLLRLVQQIPVASQWASLTKTIAVRLMMGRSWRVVRCQLLHQQEIVVGEGHRVNLLLIATQIYIVVPILRNAQAIVLVCGVQSHHQPLCLLEIS